MAWGENVTNEFRWPDGRWWQGFGREAPAHWRDVERILDTHAWFWTITGVKRGGGLDSCLVIHKQVKKHRHSQATAQLDRG